MGMERTLSKVMTKSMDCAVRKNCSWMKLSVVALGVITGSKLGSKKV